MIEIKYKSMAPGCKVFRIEGGNWYDLATAEETEIKKGSLKLVSLGVVIQLPKGYEAHLLPRSSTAKKYGILMGNSQGVVDNSYAGPNDIWKFPAYAFKDTTVPKNARIAQFRIVLSQEATVWQKLKWLFSKTVKITETGVITHKDRGGFGSTGE